MATQSAVLLILCPDRTGLVARVSTLLFEQGANILHADQHQDSEAGLFFMRVEWDLEGFDLERFRAAFTPLAASLDMTWRVESARQPPRVAIFVSSHLHCLADLLFRHRAGELACEVTSVISNHTDAGDLVAFHGIPFHHIPTTTSSRADVETRQLALLDAQRVDLVVMARYMRILSGGFITQYPGRVINVHHSFLPAFVGARPYHQAFERGVKLIGATSHYATETLDDGPIIEQDVMRISHRDHVADLIEKGRDLERIVLSRAVKWHLDHRVLRYGDKTVVFD
jgi:formyltetrahydrofolate deformylase